MSKPAARIGDMTAHGGSIVVGCPTVLIGGMPAARVGDMHVCPMLNPGVPPPPHVGGPIVMGSTGVLIGGMPAARVGDMVTCAGPPDTIVLGCFTVLIGETAGGGGGGGSGGAGGGGGGSAGSGATSAQAAQISANIASQGQQQTGSNPDSPHWIEFKFVDKAGKPVTGVNYEFTDTDGTKTAGTVGGQGNIRRDGIDPGSCTVKLFTVKNARWSVNEARVGETVKLQADIDGFESGTKAEFEIWEQDVNSADDFITKIEAETQGSKVEAEWEYEYTEDDDDIQTEEDIQKGYSAPEYYFIVRVEGSWARSDLLEYKDWIEIELKDEEDNPIAYTEYTLYLSNGEVREGTLDGNGYKKEEQLIPGLCKINFPNVTGVGKIE